MYYKEESISICVLLKPVRNIPSQKSMSGLLNVESLVRLELAWFTNELFTQQQTNRRMNREM